MSRRFLLVGFFIVVPLEGQGTIEQLAYATFVAQLFLVLQANAAPFRKAEDDFLATTCSLLLVVLFLTSIFYKYSALTGTHLGVVHVHDPG